MRVRWTDAALRDLDHAFNYLFERNTDAARAFFADVFGAVEDLARFPARGAVEWDLDLDIEVRRLVVRGQLVFYTVSSRSVFILRVWDGRRNPAELTLDSAAGDLGE